LIGWVLIIKRKRRTPLSAVVLQRWGV